MKGEPTLNSSPSGSFHQPRFCFYSQVSRRHESGPNKKTHTQIQSPRPRHETKISYPCLIASFFVAQPQPQPRPLLHFHQRTPWAALDSDPVSGTTRMPSIRVSHLKKIDIQNPFLHFPFLSAPNMIFACRSSYYPIHPF